MRLFTAIELGDATRAQAAAIISALRARVELTAPRARVTWIAQERLHLTVRFIGEVEGPLAERVISGLRAPLTLPPFTIAFGPLGAFPAKGAPRAIWIGLADGGDAVARVESAISDRLRGPGNSEGRSPVQPPSDAGSSARAGRASGGAALREPCGRPRPDASRRDYTVSEQAVAEGTDVHGAGEDAAPGRLKPAPDNVEAIIAITFGYVLGSVPFAFLVSRRRGIDLRRVGSGNVGASNVLRTTGVSAAVAAMCLDAMKGSVAVLVAQLLASPPSAIVAAGFASVVGHIHPVWLGFRGGKGVATAAGVFTVLAPAALAIAGGVFILAVWITRYISVGSLAAAVTLAIATAVSDGPAVVAVGATITAVLIAHQHRGNLSRLFSGTERRVGQRLF